MTFDELYAAYADPVYAFLRFKVRDVHLAEDLFQDTFLAAYKELSQGRQPEHPRAWLLTIAHRRMVDRLRRVSARDAPLEQAELAGVPDRREPTEAVLLQDLLDRLDDLSRTIVYALYVEGLTIQETAKLTGIPEGTVKSRCHAAKSKLSGWMKEAANDGR